VVCGVSPGCPQQTTHGFRGKNIAKSVSDTYQMKNAPIHVCAETAFMGWPSTENRQISFYNHYFRKYFKLVYRKNVVMVSLTTSIMFLLFSWMHCWVWGILRRWSACAPTIYELVCNCQKFGKHCSRGYIELHQMVLDTALVKHDVKSMLKFKSVWLRKKTLSCFRNIWLHSA
jgi:hypothetical protein